MTKKLYLDNTYLFSFEGVIQRQERDEKGTFITFDQTAFYPQGGGQPSDQGMIQNDCFKTTVVHVSQKGDEIRHYIDLQTTETLVGFIVSCQVKRERRLINARYHTAAHLLGNIVEDLTPTLKAIKGHSFPGEALC